MSTSIDPYCAVLSRSVGDFLARRYCDIVVGYGRK